MTKPRFEFKYMLDPIQEQALQSAMGHFMKPDPIAAQKGGWYYVTSLYFDTPQLGDYYDKSGGYLIRKKLRVRIYDHHLTPETPEIWLEIKKKYDMSFKKTRCLITHEDWDDIQNHHYHKLLYKNRSAEEQEKIHEFMWYLIKEGRSPTFLVRYKRVPYTDPHGSLRVTFDTKIEASRHNNLTPPPFPKPMYHGTILEVKFDKVLPGWLGALIRMFDLNRSAFSKYGMSVERLRSYNTLPR